MKRFPLVVVPILFLAAVLILAGLARADGFFFENFDGYANGTQMHGQDGWLGWLVRRCHCWRAGL